MISNKKGEKGDKGNPGERGYTPIKGVDYFDGVPGPPLSQPPEGHYKVINLFVNAQTGKLEVEYEIP